MVSNCSSLVHRPPPEPPMVNDGRIIAAVGPPGCHRRMRSLTAFASSQVVAL